MKTIYRFINQALCRAIGQPPRQGRPTRLGVSIIGIAFALTGALALMGCETTQSVMNLTILHTNDIHSHMRASPNDPYSLGGLARLKTLLDQRRQARRAAGPGAAVLTLDAGDWSEGIIYYAVDEGENMLRVLSLLGYDALTLGNHDFLNGPAHILRALEGVAVRPAVLASNLNVSAFSDGARLTRAMPPSQVFRFGDLAVGVIGLTTYEYTYSSYMRPVLITDPIPLATNIAQSMHNQGVQVILLLSHNGFEYNKILARSIPWINAVISGHSHRKVPQAEMVINAGRNVPIVETRQWGQYFGELNLSVDIPTKSVRFSNYTLHPVWPSTAEDPAVKAFIEREEQKLSQRYGSDIVHDHVGDSHDVLPQSDSHETALSNFLAHSYRMAVRADIGMDIASLAGDGLVPGPLSTMNVFNTIPHIYNRDTGKTWTIKILRLKGSDLKMMLTIWYAAANYNIPFGALATSNIDMRYRLSGLNPIEELLVGGAAVLDNQDYTIALHDGLYLALTLANAQFHLGLNLSRIDDTGIEAWRAALTNLRDLNHSTLRAADFQPGAHMHTVAADLSISEHDVHLEVIPNELSAGGASGTLGVLAHVRVHNVGATASLEGAQVLIKRGRPDDPTLEGTPLEVLQLAAPAFTLPAIAPGDHFDFDTPLTGAPTTGVYPVTLEFRGNLGFDVNRINDSVRVFFKP